MNEIKKKIRLANKDIFLSFYLHRWFFVQLIAPFQNEKYQKINCLTKKNKLANLYNKTIFLLFYHYFTHPFPPSSHSNFSIIRTTLKNINLYPSSFPTLSLKNIFYQNTLLNLLSLTHHRACHCMMLKLELMLILIKVIMIRFCICIIN